MHDPRLSIQNLILDKNSVKLKSHNLEVRFFAYGLFSEFIYTLYFEYYFYFTLLFKKKNYYVQFGQIMLFFFNY